MNLPEFVFGLYMHASDIDDCINKIVTLRRQSSHKTSFTVYWSVFASFIVSDIFPTPNLWHYNRIERHVRTSEATGWETFILYFGQYTQTGFVWTIPCAV